jgi:hypothetical protein
MVNGSGVGVKAAVNKTMEKTQIRQGLKIVVPLRNPIKFKLIRKTGSSNANPNNRMILKTKSR